MIKLSIIRSFVFSAIVLGSAAAYAFPQGAERVPKPIDAADRPQTVSSEMNDVFKRWLNEDATYIITPDERAAFLRLRTNEERENFIKIFWQRRNPDPDADENEFRAQHYERIAYANEHFSSGIPGWKTDRGRIYIMLGKPDSIESHSSGGSYERPSYEGGGSTTTYPFEIWFYRHLDGVGDGVEIEFVDQTGTSEYRISINADDKIAVANIPGLGQRNNPGNGAGNYQREPDSPFFRQMQIVALNTPPALKFDDLKRILTDSPVIDNNPLAFDLRVDFFRQSDDRVITAFTVQTSNKQIMFKPVGGLETATLNIFGRITAVSNDRKGIFEDVVTTNASTAELASLKEKSSVYQKAIVLAPGIYKVDVIVRDSGTGNRGVMSLGFIVPRYDANNLSTSSLVLASRLRPANERDAGQQFVISGTKVIPNFGSIYKQGQDVGFYLQVYNAETDQTTLRPSVDVNYVLLKDGKEVLRQAEDWTGSSDSGQRLTLAHLLPTSKLPVGEYELRIEIRDLVREKTIENSGKFRVIP